VGVDLEVFLLMSHIVTFADDDDVDNSGVCVASSWRPFTEAAVVKHQNISHPEGLIVRGEVWYRMNQSVYNRLHRGG
jgi:hypothetical protein